MAKKRKPAKKKTTRKKPGSKGKPKKKSAKKKSPKKTPTKRKSAKKSASRGRGKSAEATVPNGGEEEMGLMADPIAVRLAKDQREISISEFFTKNRHLLGFDNPKKALLTAVKEAVDNSLDACEEARIQPEVKVEIASLADDRYRVVIEDNGPGIVKAQIPNIFGKLLYGSKFHKLRMSRGQQGIGISAAGMYGQLTTGKPMRVTSRIGPRKRSHYYEIQIDTSKNKPVISREETVGWKKHHGTRVEMEMEARYTRGSQSIDDYLQRTAIVNPHVSISYAPPEGEKMEFPRATSRLPEPTKEIKPHPYGIELGMLIRMLHDTKARNLKGFLTTEFSRVSPRVAEEIMREAKLYERSRPNTIARKEADNLYRTIQKTKIMAPPSDCVAPIGEDLLLKGLKKELEADFYTASTRSPAVYRGNPFQVEVGMAFGGESSGSEDSTIKLLRYANRVPLMYQQGACAMTRAVIETSWRNYGLSQGRGALPIGPMVLIVHIASVWVPFTSESKEAIAHYPEIMKEVKLALQECGRRVATHVRKEKRRVEQERRKGYIKQYIPHIAIGLREILGFKQAEEKRIVKKLSTMLEKS